MLKIFKNIIITSVLLALGISDADQIPGEYIWQLTRHLLICWFGDNSVSRTSYSHSKAESRYNHNIKHIRTTAERKNK